MDEIFANAKNILVVWLDHLNSEMLLQFEKTLQIKAKHANIVLEDLRKLFECKLRRYVTMNFSSLHIEKLAVRHRPSI